MTCSLVVYNIYTANCSYTQLFNYDSDYNKEIAYKNITQRMLASYHAGDVVVLIPEDWRCILNLPKTCLNYIQGYYNQKHKNN